MARSFANRGLPGATAPPAALVLLVLVAGCALRPLPPPAPARAPTPAPRGAEPYVETGIASWYGKKFHGRRTANGERYDMYGMTAAHRTLPFGTRVRVTHLGNGRAVVVRINDRGPWVRGRIIDLSYGAARQLGMVREGLARVRVRRLQR